MADLVADVVICGAGIAGISAAYHLAVRHGVRNVVIVDERQPLTLTSDKSTECYRNWWPGPGDAMVALMNRSIDILEELARESDNVFNLNRRGYVFATADPNRIPDFEHAAAEAAALGAGPVRVHRSSRERADHLPYSPAPASGFENQPVGADLILDQKLIREHFPYLAEETVAVVHPRRCGWFDAQQLGMFMLERARQCGATLLRARVEGVDAAGNRVQQVRLGGSGTVKTIATDTFVIAAGPMLRAAGKMVGVDLPVHSEFHAKIAIPDHLRVVPRDAPLLIWADPQRLPWSDEEKILLAESDEARWMLGEFPSGVHARPEGPADSSTVLILWTYHTRAVEPVFPPVYDPDYPEMALRGLATMIPGLKAYFGHAPRPVVDGGYYTKTEENRPLVGPLPLQGAFVMGAFSGFGLMASPGAGDLLAAHVTGSPLPHYARVFQLDRYDNAEYRELLQNWGNTGQL